MIKLHGFPMSNYYNMAKMALLEKGLEFDEVLQMPTGEADFAAKSPMGKVPCLEVDGTFISEASVILDYIEDTAPSPALFPQDTLQRAKTRELMKYCELYCDLAVRPTFGEAFFGGTVSEEVKQTAEGNITRGLAAIGHLARFDPFIAGADFSHADIVAYHTLPMAANVGAKLFGRNPLDALPGANDYLARIAERPSAQQIKAAQRR